MSYDLKLQLEPGRHRILVAVRDDVSRLTSTVVQEIDLAKNGTATPVDPAPVKASGRGAR